MKRTVAAGMLSLLSFQVLAGSVAYQAPATVTVVEPPMGLGPGSWIIPLVILSVLALAISAKSTQTAL